MIPPSKEHRNTCGISKRVKNFVRLLGDLEQRLYVGLHSEPGIPQSPMLPHNNNFCCTA